MIQAVKRLPTSPTQKLLLLVLADCHNEKTGQCNPSYRYIMDVTGLSNKAVSNNLKALRNCGTVTFDSRNGSNTHYNLTPERHKAVNLVHQFEGESSEPSSQVTNSKPVNLVPKPVNLVPKSSEPGSHKPVLTVEPELLFAPASPKPRVRKPKKESTADPRHKPFIEIWSATYQRIWEAKYHFQSGKDGKALQTFLQNEKSMTADEWHQFINWIHQTKLTDGKFANGTIKAATGSLAIACHSYNQLLTHA